MTMLRKGLYKLLLLLILALLEPATLQEEQPTSGEETDGIQVQ